MFEKYLQPLKYDQALWSQRRPFRTCQLQEKIPIQEIIILTIMSSHLEMLPFACLQELHIIFLHLICHLEPHLRPTLCLTIGEVTGKLV